MALLSNKVAVVVGGASGIGAATAKLFVQHGAKVLIGDINPESGEKLAAELAPNVAFASCDVRSEDSIKAAVTAAVEHFGRLDVMVNCAGILGAVGPIEEMDPAHFEGTLQINLTGTLLGMKHAIRVMKQQPEGGRGCSIVNISSVAGLRGSFASAGYCAAKWGVIGLTQLAAAEVVRSGIRVNVVAPTAVETGMTRTLTTGDPHTPMGDAPSPFHLLPNKPTAQDIADAILYLASDLSRSVNGHTLVVDQGMTVGVTGNVPPMSALPSHLIGEGGKLGVNRDEGNFQGMVKLQQP